MGSYNVNCALTNLPITEREDVKILLLTEQEDGKFTEVSQFFKPLFPFFLNATYDDSGNFILHDSENVKAQVVGSYLRANLTDRETFSMQNLFSDITRKPYLMVLDVVWPKADAKGKRIHYAAYKASVVDRLFAGVHEHHVWDMETNERNHLSFADKMKADTVLLTLDTDTTNVVVTAFNIVHERKRNSLSQGEEMADGSNQFLELIQQVLAVGDDKDSARHILLDALDGHLSNAELRALFLTHSPLFYKTHSYGVLAFMRDYEGEIVPVEEYVKFYAFHAWLDDQYHGMFIPSRYADQDICTEAHTQLASIVEEVARESREEE